VKGDTAVITDLLMKKRKPSAVNHEKANIHEKRNMDHTGVIHVLDGCHLCEHYIIMYAYMIINIYVYTDILCAVCEWGNPWSKCCILECHIQ